MDSIRFRELADAAHAASSRLERAQVALREAEDEVIAARKADNMAHSAFDGFVWEQAGFSRRLGKCAG